MVDGPDVAGVEAPADPAVVVDAAVPQTDTTDVTAKPEPAHPLEERQRDRQPARKDRATPKDVPTIQALSGMIRELTAKDEADAPRVAELRKKLRTALDLEPPAAKPEPVRRQAPPVMPGDFAEPRPTIEQFADSDDPYGERLLALAAWDRRREAHEANRQYTQQQHARFQQEQHQVLQQLAQSYVQRVTAAKTRYADWDQVVTASQVVTPVMERAILSAPNGEEMTYFLAKHPDILDDLVLQTAAVPVDDTSVALLQRRLNARLTAGTTGAAPTKPVLVAPRPPTPVRTGVMKTGETPPGDDADIDEHRRFYGVGSRRKR